MFETKVLWGELFHVVTHCKKRDGAQSKVRARICACVCVCVRRKTGRRGVGVDTYSSGFLDFTIYLRLNSPHNISAS